MRVINEKQKCSLCGKVDMGVLEKNGEFICRECFQIKYVTPEILAEVNEIVDILLKD